MSCKRISRRSEGWNDALTLSLRVQLFNGTNDSPLGQYRDDYYAELALRWSI